MGLRRGVYGAETEGGSMGLRLRGVYRAETEGVYRAAQCG